MKMAQRKKEKPLKPVTIKFTDDQIIFMKAHKEMNWAEIFRMTVDEIQENKHKITVCQSK